MGNYQFTPNGEKTTNKIINLEKYFISDKFLDDNLVSSSIYEDLKIISEGSFSSIYSFKNHYAIKIMKNNYSKYLDNIPELYILGKLQNEYIVKFYGYFNIDSKLAIVMKRYDFNLGSYLFRNDKDRISVIEQISIGLDFLHKNNILHLDLTPNNILVDDSGDNPRIVISDFSHSCLTFNLSVLSISHRISPFYRPYENLKGSLIYSDKSDIWSLGIIVLEILNKVKIGNIIIPVIVELEYDPEMSMILFIERMVAWNKWSNYLNNSNYNCLLDIDPLKRSLVICNKDLCIEVDNKITTTFNVQKHISFNIYGIINEDISLYYYRTERLYSIILDSYDNRWLMTIFNSNFELYKLCFFIIYSMYNFPDKILPLLNINHCTFILRVIGDLKFQI